MHPKDADGMANSVDPDQTASSELFAETYLSQYIEFVRYIRNGDIVHGVCFAVVHRQLRVQDPPKFIYFFPFLFI